jgi:hypothetical protein
MNTDSDSTAIEASDRHAIAERSRSYAAYESEVLSGEFRIVEKWLPSRREGESCLHISATHADSSGYWSRTDLTVETR